MLTGAIEGRFLELLVFAAGARRVLEIGTFTGYSALAVALALPADGTVTALDVSEDFTAVAREYWQRAGVESRIDLRIGPALEQAHHVAHVAVGQEATTLHLCCHLLLVHHLGRPGRGEPARRIRKLPFVAGEPRLPRRRLAPGGVA